MATDVGDLMDDDNWYSLVSVISTGSCTLMLGPAAILWALWFWRRPASILPRTKARSVIAILVGLASTGGWGFWAYKMFTDGNL